MATLRKQGARKLLATDGRSWPSATSWHEPSKARGYSFTVVADDGKQYEVTLSADEMMGAVSCWIGTAFRENTLTRRPKP